MSIKKSERCDKFKKMGSGRVPIVQDCGVSVPVPCVKLLKSHPCKGCVWYAKDTDVLFCPLPNCIRKK